MTKILDQLLRDTPLRKLLLENLRKDTGGFTREACMVSHIPPEDVEMLVKRVQVKRALGMDPGNKREQAEFDLYLDINNAKASCSESWKKKALDIAEMKSTAYSHKTISLIFKQCEKFATAFNPTEANDQVVKDIISKDLRLQVSSKVVPPKSLGSLMVGELGKLGVKITAESIRLKHENAKASHRGSRAVVIEDDDLEGSS